MESQDQDQLWACLTCRTVRTWGIGKPCDEAFVPLLQCAPCAKPQRFTYLSLGRGEHWEWLEANVATGEEVRHMKRAVEAAVELSDAPSSKLDLLV